MVGYGNAIVSPDEITKAEFEKARREYTALIQVISETKATITRFKTAQKTLAELDKWRYKAILKQQDGQSSLSYDDVQQLVEWKLRHGKFRPMIQKYIDSNDPASVESCISAGLAIYHETKDASAGMAEIVKHVKGMGPATASLMLSVFDPNKVIFFSDEAYLWLCCDYTNPSASKIKYNMREYQNLDRAARLLAARLGVRAVDVEQVAFVLMHKQYAAARAMPSPPVSLAITSPTPPRSKRTPSDTIAKLEMDKDVVSSGKADLSTGETVDANRIVSRSKDSKTIGRTTAFTRITPNGGWTSPRAEFTALRELSGGNIRPAAVTGLLTPFGNVDGCSADEIQDENDVPMEEAPPVVNSKRVAAGGKPSALPGKGEKKRKNGSVAPEEPTRRSTRLKKA
ncbi:hypothetical protein ACKVWC_004206 [Pyricularia oryzae]|uniref:Uncharacterized protein n=2 Tax=Pyricularia oryzae TaxID=318829 RepID=A0AA97NW58_PYRO3|nr:hypothetical protein OOU_Y34scaffold00594g5 [Pyricularia oryzae Y34]KAI7929498.1 hypothetical protein M0657_002176 [Pyricularia oryzae]